MVQTTDNPLSNYFRDVAIYMKLPSSGFYTPEGDIEATSTGEIAVYPMTTADELLFKSPDALLNGEAIANVIQSCAPGIKNVYTLPSNDVEALLLAIRHSTYGDQMDFEDSCPECGAIKEFGISIEAGLHSIKQLEPDVSVTLDNDLVVKIRPYTYASSVKAASLAFNEEKFLQMLMEEDLDDNEKAVKAAESFVRATTLTMDLLADSIIAVITKDGELITDQQEHILPWLNNISRPQSKVIEDKILEMNLTGINKQIEISCDACEHTWLTNVEFDPSNFFGDSF